MLSLIKKKDTSLSDNCNNNVSTEFKPEPKVFWSFLCGIKLTGT